jgi:hypothetical protein
MEYNFMTLTMDDFMSTHFQKACTVIDDSKHCAWSDVFAMDQRSKQNSTEMQSDCTTSDTSQKCGM